MLAGVERDAMPGMKLLIAAGDLVRRKVSELRMMPPKVNFFPRAGFKGSI
jgi:hypothetical protein